MRTVGHETPRLLLLIHFVYYPEDYSFIFRYLFSIANKNMLLEQLISRWIMIGIDSLEQFSLKKCFHYFKIRNNIAFEPISKYYGDKFQNSQNGRSMNKLTVLRASQSQWSTAAVLVRSLCPVRSPCRATIGVLHDQYYRVDWIGNWTWKGQRKTGRAVVSP